MKPYRKSLKPLARQLRSNMTEAENLLWQKLRRKQVHGVQFYRQKPLLGYIVDFYCPKVLLVIELDGSQHLETEHLREDRHREAALKDIGLQVLRFDNRQVLLETEAVVETIARVVRERL